jgi:site-specific DNA recombinase
VEPPKGGCGVTVAETTDQQPSSIKRAVFYLRVSTVSQVKTDYDPEGISIPAQRLSCERKVAQMGVEVVGEYVEPGRSGTNIEHRPIFKEMIERIQTEQDVDYVIVYKLSRLNRNRVDDAKVLMMLRKQHVTLVSATESIDETPVGQLMHGILASFNEFRSAEDGADIRYKMGQKAKNGGTLGRAPLGYENAGIKFEGREIRSVIVDVERAPFIKRLYELYATGEYSLERLQAQIRDEGLTTRPTSRRPGGQVSLEEVRLVLRNPYYRGIVTYKGEQYPGRHEPLITSEMWDRVQQVVEARSARENRDRKHRHYLRGFLYCDRCRKAGHESRLLYTLARGQNGNRWAYYVCRGRDDNCDLPSVPVARVEAAVIDEYRMVQVPETLADLFDDQIDQLLGEEQRGAAELQANLKVQLSKLDHAEERLLDLLADGTLPSTKVRGRLTRLAVDRARLQAEMVVADQQLKLGAELLRSAIQLSKDPQEMYRQAPDEARRQLNGCFYERFYVDEEGVEVALLTKTFADLGGAVRAAQTDRQAGERTTRKTPPALGEAVDWADVDLMTAIALAGGLRKTALVRLGGIEPPTPALFSAPDHERAPTIRPLRCVPPATIVTGCRPIRLVPANTRGHRL